MSAAAEASQEPLTVYVTYFSYGTPRASFTMQVSPADAASLTLNSIAVELQDREACASPSDWSWYPAGPFPPGVFAKDMSSTPLAALQTKVFSVSFLFGCNARSNYYRAEVRPGGNSMAEAFVKTLLAFGVSSPACQSQVRAMCSGKPDQLAKAKALGRAMQVCVHLNDGVFAASEHLQKDVEGGADVAALEAAWAAVKAQCEALLPGSGLEGAPYQALLKEFEDKVHCRETRRAVWEARHRQVLTSIMGPLGALPLATFLEMAREPPPPEAVTSAGGGAPLGSTSGPHHIEVRAGRARLCCANCHCQQWWAGSPTLIPHPAPCTLPPSLAALEPRWGCSSHCCSSGGCRGSHCRAVKQTPTQK